MTRSHSLLAHGSSSHRHSFGDSLGLPGLLAHLGVQVILVHLRVLLGIPLLVHARLLQVAVVLLVHVHLRVPLLLLQLQLALLAQGSQRHRSILAVLRSVARALHDYRCLLTAVVAAAAVVGKAQQYWCQLFSSSHNKKRIQNAKYSV